jgi:hypothetical protein
VEADSISFQRIVGWEVYICLHIHITLFFPLDLDLEEGYSGNKGKKVKVTL